MDQFIRGDLLVLRDGLQQRGESRFRGDIDPVVGYLMVDFAVPKHLAIDAIDPDHSARRDVFGRGRHEDVVARHDRRRPALRGTVRFC